MVAFSPEILHACLYAVVHIIYYTMQEEVDSDIDENESGGSTSPVVQDEGVWQRHRKREYTETQVTLSPRTGI